MGSLWNSLMVEPVAFTGSPIRESTVWVSLSTGEGLDIVWTNIWGRLDIWVCSFYTIASHNVLIQCNKLKLLFIPFPFHCSFIHSVCLAVAVENLVHSKETQTVWPTFSTSSSWACNLELIIYNSINLFACVLVATERQSIHKVFAFLTTTPSSSSINQPTSMFWWLCWFVEVAVDTSEM